MLNLDIPLGSSPAAGAGATTVFGLPNKLTLYLKESELIAVKSSRDQLLVVHLFYIDKVWLKNLDNYLNILLSYT